jgi:hypothetical protein
MRIVSWNCNMGLARKAPRLLALQPDVAVVQECAASSEVPGMAQVGWTGRHPSKGLAVFARASLGAVVAKDVWDPTREWFLPIRIASVQCDLLAGWAMHHRGQEDRPKVGRIHAAIEHYRPFISSSRTLVIGDLNDNVMWDTPRNPSFARLTSLLAEMGLVNLYHARTGETPGKESRGSLFFYRHADRPYLIDHAFVPEAWLGRVSEMTLGEPGEWLDVSDHTPLLVALSSHDTDT